VKNKFLKAYCEGQKKVNALNSNVAQVNELVAEIQLDLEDGMVQFSNPTGSYTYWEITIRETATLSITHEMYTLTYTTNTVLCSDISDLRAAILDMFRDPEMH
jgi:hypothetical protein